MPPQFLPSIDIASFDQDIPSSLNLKSLSHFRNVYAPLSSIEAALGYVKKTAGTLNTTFDASQTLLSEDDLTLLLDAGVNVIVNGQQYKSLSSAKNVDPARLICSIDQGDSQASVAIALNEPVHLARVPDIASLRTQLTSRNPHDVQTYVSFAQITPELALEAAKLGAIPVVPSSMITTQKNPSQGQIGAADLLMAGAKSDRPDGLFTTLVTDERGIALGLVYSSLESVSESLRLGRGVYQSRKRGLWYKGESSGDTQELVNISFDCDTDCLAFSVRQAGRGFCHLAQSSCFGDYKGLSKLQQTLLSRKASAPVGSYTARLFNDEKLLSAKIREEADELCSAKTKDEIAFEAADLFYFALTRCIASGVTLEDVERNLDLKSVKVKRRTGDAKPAYLQQNGTSNGTTVGTSSGDHKKSEMLREAASIPKSKDDRAGLSTDGRIRMTRYDTSKTPPTQVQEALKRPSQRSTDQIMGIVKPIIQNVQQNGDKAVLEYTHRFEKATSLNSAVLKAPFPEHLRQLPQETIDAIDISYSNIRKFHAAQREEKPLAVETMPGVVCSRFSRPIERVGLYVPGGTAVLPSTALMLGVPAQVAGCKTIVLASPPRSDGSITPEIVYVAHKIGAESIVLAGGAQAVAAMAYGTESITKCDKILGPGNQFVTAAKMLVSNDTSANVAIDMPAGPSEVLVVADSTSNPAFVAADLLSQAEHGVDSQVVCIAVGMSETEVQAIEDEVHKQAMALPRVDIVRGAIEHSVTLCVKDIAEAMKLANDYASEHLIIQTEDPDYATSLVENAGSVFIGPWTPESVGDYSAGVNHSLPTYGYARQYSGVNLGSYLKHITSSKLSAEGLKNVGGAVMQLAKVEELEAHRRAVEIRIAAMQ